MKTASTTILAIFLNLLLAFSCHAQDRAQQLLSTLPEQLGMASFQVLLQDFDRAAELLKTIDAAIAVEAQGCDQAITFGP